MTEALSEQFQNI